jgi:hypothetical protein
LRSRHGPDHRHLQRPQHHHQRQHLALAAAFSDTTALDGKYRFVYRRTAEAHEDDSTTIVVEYGTDPGAGSWLPAAHQGIGPDEITITVLEDGFGEGVDRVTVALPPSLAASGKLFVRLAVTVAAE